MSLDFYPDCTGYENPPQISQKVNTSELIQMYQGA